VARKGYFGFVWAKVCLSSFVPIASGSVNQVTDNKFKSPYGELASALGSNARAIDSIIAQHAIQVKNISPEQSQFPFDLYGNVNYTHENGKRYNSDDAIALVGLDFSYNNFILERVCTAGIFGGVFKDFIHYRCDELSKGNVRAGFGGYYSDFTILGLDISMLSFFGSGKSNTDCPTLNFSGTDFSHFTHNHRIIHNRIAIGHSWAIGDLELTPTIGLHADQLTQKGATEWQQDSLRFRTIDGVGGLKIEKDLEKFYVNSFLGIEHNLNRRWSGGAIKVNDVPEDFNITALDKTKFLISVGLNYDCTESCTLEAYFSGRYGPRHKSSTFGLTLNKIF
jgi:hypothetical protein